MNSVMRRFLSSLATARKPMTNAIAAVARDDKNAWLKVSWENGQESRFPYIWLRDNSPQEHTYHLTDYAKARQMLLIDLDPNVAPEAVENGGDHVFVQWPNDKPATYTTEWLKQHNLDDPEVRASRSEVAISDRVLWNASTFHKLGKYWDFERLFTDPKYLHDAMTTFCAMGILLLKNVSSKSKQMNRLADLVGYTYCTHHKDFWEVKVVRNPSNLAYTSGKLGFHSDLPYMRYTPEIQCFHAVKSEGIEGGESQLVDAFYVADQIKRDHPYYYELLSTVPIEYIDEGKNHAPFDMNYRWPLLNFDRYGRLDFVIHSNQHRGWFYECPVEKLNDVMKALITFNQYLYKEGTRLEFKLNEGEAVVFANLRVLHARKGFQVTDTCERILEGCFFNWDVWKSKIRVLRDQLDLQPNQISV